MKTLILTLLILFAATLLPAKVTRLSAFETEIPCLNPADDQPAKELSINALENNVVFRFVSVQTPAPQNIWTLPGNSATDEVKLSDVNTSTWQTRDRSSFEARQVSPGVYLLESHFYRGQYLYPMENADGEAVLGVRAGTTDDPALRFTQTAKSGDSSPSGSFGFSCTLNGTTMYVFAEGTSIALSATKSGLLTRYDFIGTTNSAYRWQGENSENVQSSMTINPTPLALNESFTIEMWINRSAGNLPYNFSLFGSPGVPNAIELILNGSAGHLTFGYVYGTNYGDRYIQDIGVVVPQGWSWHHIAITMGPDVGGPGVPLRIEFNGATVALPNAQLLRGLPLPATRVIKNLGGGSQLPFPGQISDFRIWKTARTHAEVIAWKNRRIPGSEWSKMLAYYPLNGSLGDAARPGAVSTNNNLTRIPNAGVPF